jgi:murein DD-endopeptidase MepM/ murein hydrolase activator NlpD
MKKRFLSFTFIPHTSKETHQYKIPLYISILLLCGSLVISVSLGIFIKNHYMATITQRELSIQEKKNALLNEKAEKYENELKEIRTEMESLTELRSRMEDPFPHQKFDQFSRVQKESIKSSTSANMNLKEARKNLFQLFQDVKSQKKSFNSILNLFNDNPRISQNLPSILPVRGWITTGFGDRENPFTGRTEIHEGIDIASLPGTNIHATAAGIVRSTGYRLDLGYYIIIDHGFSIKTTYGHCSKLKVRKGSRVKRGQNIAFVGKSGKTIGPCVHYEIRVKDHPVDPLSYVLESMDFVQTSTGG